LKRALISVYDKTGVADFASWLKSRGYEIISTGGTHRHLKEQGLEPLDISQVTGFPEMLDGRVKTLHPKIHGGLLALRNNKEHMKTIKDHAIDTIDLVIVNLYPFFEESQKDIPFAEKIEFIDIGGPSMLRSAAKNFQDVIVITDPDDYDVVIKETEETGDLSFETRKDLAGKVFALTSAYDGAIARFLLGDTSFPEYLPCSYKLHMDLRYGENPHQRAAYYVPADGRGAMADFDQIGGKELSFNNIRDMDAAWKIVSELGEKSCCAVKHSTPCGVASGTSALEAYKKTFDCDSMSIFGGIVAYNGEIDESAAAEMAKIFLEIIIAPSFTKEALGIFNAKKNLRVIRVKCSPGDPLEVVKVDGGILVQEADRSFSTDYEVVTQLVPDDKMMKDLIFAQKVVKHVKSNAIVVAHDGMAVGIGNGQTNRIWAAQQALERAAGRASVLASDAYFPFDDVVKAAAAAGIKAIIQPGGSVKDADSIKACDEAGIAMVITGMRHFKH
jgi:phosphoribosylaminoimidazolecarboxamide formyltransferase/IMP cyclohydrolase